MESSSTGTRVYLSLIGLMLVLAGGVFLALMWRSYQRAREVESWPLVPCVILRSEVEERQVDPNGPVERSFGVLYGYVWEGVNRDSDRWSLRGSSWTTKEEEVQELVARYPEGSEHSCRVNPADPARAVLETESKAPGYSIWFPGLFVVGGLGIIAGAWRRGAGPAGG